MDKILGSTDEVIFPGPTQGSVKQKFIPQIPEECKKLGICENAPDYPEDYVTTLLDRVRYFNS